MRIKNIFYPKLVIVSLILLLIWVNQKPVWENLNANSVVGNPWLVLKYAFMWKHTDTINNVCDIFMKQAVIEADIIHPLAHLLPHAEFDIMKESAWAISNAFSGGSHELIRYISYYSYYFYLFGLFCICALCIACFANISGGCFLRYVFSYSHQDQYRVYWGLEVQQLKFHQADF